jgi:uncharacterized membrane protein
MIDTVMSVTVLAAFVLMGGSIWLWRKQGPGKQSILMMILAFIMLFNVVIWAVPLEPAESGADKNASTASGD